MQTWTIKGKTYNHAQLMELKKQKLDPLNDEIVVKYVTPKKEEKVAEVKQEEVENISCEVCQCDCNCHPCEHTKEDETNAKADPIQAISSDETPEQEFERLTKEKAWLKNDKKERYNELKALLAKN